MTRAARTVPDWAIGCMDRAWIRLDGGTKDPSVAIWIQTGSQYFDLRVRHDRPDFRGRGSLEDFSADELLELARQSGDTGVCNIERGVATWNSWSDRFGFFCDDVASFSDDGRLEPKGKVLYEYETAKSPLPYEEAWVQQPYDHGLVAHLTLRDAQSRGEVFAVLLVTGRYAGYVERSTSGNRLSLESQLAAAGRNPARARSILACEASYAIRPRAGAPYVIRHSNLPFREGQALEVPPMDRRVLERTRILPAEREHARWQVESWFVHPPGRGRKQHSRA